MSVKHWRRKKQEEMYHYFLILLRFFFQLSTEMKDTCLPSDASRENRNFFWLNPRFKNSELVTVMKI